MLVFGYLKKIMAKLENTDNVFNVYRVRLCVCTCYVSLCNACG